MRRYLILTDVYLYLQEFVSLCNLSIILNAKLFLVSTLQKILKVFNIANKLLNRQHKNEKNV